MLLAGLRHCMPKEVLLAAQALHFKPSLEKYNHLMMW